MDVFGSFFEWVGRLFFLFFGVGGSQKKHDSSGPTLLKILNSFLNKYLISVFSKLNKPE